MAVSVRTDGKFADVLQIRVMFDLASGIVSGRGAAASRSLRSATSILLRVAALFVLLPGTVVLAQASVSPSTLNWVSVPVGGKGGQKVVTLTNTGTASITISSIGFSGANPGDFLIFSKTCGSSLAASSSCTANIIFAPTTTGARSATLNFKDSAANSPQTMTLTGTGTAAAGSVSANPTSLTFSSTNVGSSSASQTVTLSNGLSSSITISSVAISGTNASDFNIASKTCSTSLAASGSCTASISFKPTATGARTATLSFTDSATNSPQKVTLTGTGASTSGGSATASPTSLNWVAVPVGGRGGQKVVTLTNNGTTTITISSLTMVGTNPKDFLIYSKTCGTSLAASASCTANIVFGPTTTGLRYATLDLNDSAGNSPQTVALSGNGTPVSGSVTASPSSVTFASTNVGSSSAAQTVTLSNGLSTSITISSVALSGTNAGDFSIASKSCGTSLAAAASCTASVIFKPTAAGTRTATLSFTDSATNSPQSVSLTGTGSSTAFTIAPLNPSVAVNGTLQFTASAGATWTATCGTIGSGTGFYTAPATTGSCTVKATATSGGATASTTVTVTSSTGQVTITPTSISLHAIGQAQFTANGAVTWSASCGSISSSGLFTAPAATETCTIKAVSTTNSSNSATASANVRVVNYTTRKNGTDGTGVQPSELVLTPTNVSSGKFGQIFPSIGLDGPVWGQPLYMNGITVGGKLRNVLYVTTSNDSVYAFDADTGGTALWKKSFLSTGVTAVPGTVTKISTQTGILGTPVIDPVKKAIFVVAETSENNATSFPHRLHALSLTTGSELTAPVLISDSNLQPIMKFQRPGLLLANGMVYVAFGSIEDRAPYHGLLFAFDENTLEQKAVFNVTPTGSEGGLWMSGASPEADSEGNIYISTGNGSAGTNNFGESIVKLSPTLQELDYFTPFNFSSYDTDDLDMGSGSLILVPDQNGPYAHEIIACGKPTPIYVINRDAFGGRGTTSDNIIQRLDHQIGNTGSVRDAGQPCYNSPAMWQQNVYFAPNNDVLKMFVLNPNTGMLSSTPVSKGPFTYNWPGADPVISSNGNTNGIVWTIDVGTSTLRANDATDVSKPLYVSPSLGSATRWVPPMVANGHVYVTASGRIFAFGITP